MSNLIQLTGYSQTGTACPLPQPVSLQLSRAVDSPADGLELTLPLPQDLPPLCKVKAQLPGDILFIGEVDEEERVSSPKGELLSLFARSDGALLLENLPLLEQFGFACEDFGAGALLVREVPADIDAADTVPTLEEFAERLRTGRSPDEKREALLHTMACKAAIKGGWVSDPAELRVLVDRVQSGEIKYCPHGRPVAVKLTKYELEKMFKRA